MCQIATLTHEQNQEIPLLTAHYLKTFSSYEIILEHNLLEVVFLKKLDGMLDSLL